MLTATGRAALALGAGAYVAGWVFGTAPLYPVGVGLVLVVAVAWLWARLLARPVRLERLVPEERPVDGEDVPIRVRLELDGAVQPAVVELRDRFGALGEEAVDLRRDEGALAGTYVLRDVRRGRYRAELARVAIEDPLGLVRREVPLESPGGLLVYPRIVELEGLFTDGGQRVGDGRRTQLRRQSGYDLHSVREHERGESLRRVHWPSTARRGKLMVKELEDAPRDESVVVLDGDAGTVAGEGRDTSFELAVRAAGSVARVHSGRGRRVGLLLNDADRSYQPVTSLEGDWTLALELLAGAEPNGRRPVVSLLAEGAGVASQATDLVVVTAGLNARLAERLLQRASSRRGTALVFVDPASFGASPGTGPALDARAQLLRLERAGVPVAVLRRGDDLAQVLGGLAARIEQREAVGA